MQKMNNYEIPELFPQPKQLSLTGGNSSFSSLFRVESAPALSSLQKTVCSILTSAGGSLSSDPSCHCMKIQVRGPETFQLADVPLALRKEYCEIRIQDRETLIAAPSREGILRGAQTLKDLFRRIQRGGLVPCAIIRDWPAMSNRGIFVESKWGPDRMTLQDWYQTIDSVAGVKMNLLGIGIYGCWAGCRFEGRSNLSEFLMVPVAGHPELDKVHHLRWFSPAEMAEKELSYREIMREQDLLGKIAEYARERGVTVIPFVNSLGHNTLIPRLYPDISAKDDNGDPTQYGYCLSNPRTKEFIQDFYSSIIDRCDPQGMGMEYFHIQLDEIGNTLASPSDPSKIVSPWCQCPECRKRSRQEQLSDYIVWLVRMLIGKGVGKVILWNDMLTKEMSLLTPDFVARLDQEGLRDRMILDFWDYDNNKIDPLRAPASAEKADMESWITPMTCYYDWAHYNYSLPNIDLMMKLGFAAGSTGATAYCVHNPSHLEHEAALAGYAWEHAENTDAEAYASSWGTARFAEHGRKLETGLRLLREVSGSGNWDRCGSYFFNYFGKRWPRQYPLEVLERFEAEPEDPIPLMQEKVRQARKADRIFSSLQTVDGLRAEETACVKSLRAESSRMCFYAEALAWLLALRRKLTNDGAVSRTHVTECSELRRELLDLMAVTEANTPAWVLPSSLALLTPVYDFFGQLERQLREVADGKRAVDAIQWYAELPVF